jgi:prepilin-type N-terminal cleavage/methylation domain-containing protein
MRARPLPNDEAGFSLVEVLITVVIVGIAFAAILGGMVTSIVVSDVHRKQASSDALARSAAEALKDQAVAYVNCAAPNDYASALPPAPGGYGVSVSSVQYWDGTSSDPVSFSESCPSPDKGMQLITVVAGSGDGRASETVEFVKRATS